jgi:transposase-like protein
MTDHAAFDPLDDEFPLGDGTADSHATVACPYCGAANEIGIDAGSGAVQDYVEDCQVCCRPWRVRVSYRADGAAAISVDTLD